MYKELFICIFIIVLIFTFDYILQKYTETAIADMNASFNKISLIIKNKRFNSKKVEKQTKNLFNKWTEYKGKLSYFIEHTELEKVDTSFTVYKSYIESKKYEEAIAELEKTVYILNHINQKYSFNLENIF